MFLSHKFRSCQTEQMIFLACKKRSSQIWRISVFENRNLKLISPFLISCRKHCSKFIRCSRFLRWTWRQAFSSRVISLSTLCTCSSLLYHCSKFPRCNWCSRWLTILSILSIQWWSQHFSKFAIFKIRVCNALVWVIVGMHLWLEVGRLCTNFFQINPDLRWWDFGSYFSQIFPVFETDLFQDSFQALFFWARVLEARSLRCLIQQIWARNPWEMGFVLIRHSVVEYRRVNMGRESWALGVLVRQ